MTVTLEAGLVRRLEQQRKKDKSSRSALVEKMLLETERQRKREALDKEIEEYYRTMSPAERAESEAISRAGTKATIEAWKADPDLAKDQW